MEKELQELIANVKSLVAAKDASESQIENLNTQLEQFKTLGAENEELKEQLNEIKNSIADLEIKRSKSPSLEEKQAQFKSAAKAVVRDWMLSGRQVSLKDFAKGHEKALNVGGDFTGGDFPSFTGDAGEAIERELGATIHEAAREASAIFNALGRKSVSTTDYSELVLHGYPNVAKGTEQTGGTNNTTTVDTRKFTATQSYKRVHLNVGKQYAKPLITTEALNDPSFNVWAHLQTLLTREQSYYWEYMCLFGDGTADNIRGILSTKRLDLKAGGESWKDTLPPYSTDNTKILTRTRGVEFFQAFQSPLEGESGKKIAIDPSKGTAAEKAKKSGELIDFLIDLESYLPTAHQAGAVWYMNRRTKAILKKLRNSDGDLILTSEREGGFALLGNPIVIADFLPDYPTTTQTDGKGCWIMFGNLGKAAAIADIDENYIVDPYSVDGAVQIKSDIRKGDIMQANDAVVMGVAVEKK